MATIDNKYGAGVVYTAAIDLGAKKPLDSRIAVQTIAERDAHVTGNRAFPGMQVYVADDEKTYIYNGTSWDVLITDADLTEGVDVKIAAATTGKIGGILAGTDISVDGSGNATVNQAAKLTTVRNVTLTGDATGTSTFDGSADLSIAVDVPGLDSKVAITGQTGDVDLTGATVKVKTLSKTEAQSAEGTTAASIQFVSDVVDARIAQSDAMIYKGTVADKTTITDVNTTAKTGWTYRVTADLDFTGDAYVVSDVKEAHAGDLIICRTDGSVETPATWDIVKHNDDGQVIGPESSVADRIVTFAGSTGKVVKDSGKTLADISSEIDADVSAAKTELIGTASDASTLNTINAAKKYADEKVATLDEAVLKNVSIPTPSGDAAPSVSVADNTATIKLPAYALDSKVTTLEGRVAANEAKLVGIDSTVTAYVGTQVGNAKTALIGTDDDEATADTIKGAKKYADNVAGDLTTLEGRVDGLEGEIDANTDKLADVGTTVGAAIDSKINTAVGADGVIDTAIDSVISAGLNDGGVIDNKIDSLISTAVGSLQTYEAYTAEEVKSGISTWPGFNN